MHGVQPKRPGCVGSPGGDEKGAAMLRPREMEEEVALAGGFYWFFLFGFFFFFLFFFLEFVAYEFEDGDFGSVADAVARGDDASVAAGAICEFGRDFAEEFFGDSGGHDVSGGLAA